MCYVWCYSIDRSCKISLKSGWFLLCKFQPSRDWINSWKTDRRETLKSKVHGDWNSMCVFFLCLSSLLQHLRLAECLCGSVLYWLCSLSSHNMCVCMHTNLCCWIIDRTTKKTALPYALTIHAFFCTVSMENLQAVTSLFVCIANAFFFLFGFHQQYLVLVHY